MPYNYKQLCNLLGDAYYKDSGNVKKNQILNWSRYFDFIKDGYKYIIKEIYTQPKPKIIKNRNCKFNVLSYWLLLNDDEYDYKPIDYIPDAVFKSQLLCKLGFCSHKFMRVSKEKGIDNPAVSFVYSNINSKYNGVIKSLKDNGLIKYYDFLEVIDLASREVREPTLDEEMTIFECEDTAIFNCFKLIAQYHNPTIPQKNKAISVIVMYRMFSKYLEFKSDEIKKRLNIQVRKRVKYSVIQEPVKKIDLSEIETDETLRDDYGVLKWELVRHELNKRVNQSLLKSLEKKMYHEDPKKRFSEEVAAGIKELIDLNYIPLTVYDNDNDNDDDYKMIDDYEDYTMI